MKYFKQKVSGYYLSEQCNITDFQNIINSYTNYPFLTEVKSHYEGMLGKNKESFFNINYYSTEFSSSYSIFLNISLALFLSSWICVDNSFRFENFI